MTVAVVAINFECLQLDRQFAERKRRHAARCEIESRTALRLGPAHVIRMLVCHEHEQEQCSTKEHGHLGCVARQASCLPSKTSETRRDARLPHRQDACAPISVSTSSNNSKPGTRPA